MIEIFAFNRLYKKQFDVREYNASPSNTEAQNTAAFTACIDAVYTAGGGSIFIPEGVFNGHMLFPATNIWTVVEVVGAYPPAQFFGTIGSAALPLKGTIIQSNNTAYGAVIKQSPNPNAFWQQFSSAQIILRNLDIRTANNPAIHAVDLGYAQQMCLYSLQITNGLYSVDSSNPSNGKAGLIMPERGNGALNYMLNICISGYYNGMIVHEHANGDNIQLTCNYQAMNFKGADHASWFGRVCAQRNTRGLVFNERHYVDIMQLDLEHADLATQTNANNAWQVTEWDIVDSNNLGRGESVWHNVKGGSGATFTFLSAPGRSEYRCRHQFTGALV